MDELTLNAALRITSGELAGLYRVVAIPMGAQCAWLAYIGSSGDQSQTARNFSIGGLINMDLASIRELKRLGELVAIELVAPAGAHRELEGVSDKERKLYERRSKQMEPFFDHRVLSNSLVSSGGIGPVVQMALERGDGTRATVYRLWRLLCLHGFEQASLLPRFDLCGAPGVLRPLKPGQKKVGAKTLREDLNEPVESPQRGMTEEDRIKILHHARVISKPGLPFSALYDQLIRRIYVTQYLEGREGCQSVLPTKGTFPNKRQVRHILESGVSRLERVLRATTQGHFQRNLRGLRGMARDGVAGPGHAYAIDATIGDIHLRSSVNRAWFVGRPIVYVVVDIWSTAIVGFYVCLSGPSWRMAKLALFSTFADPPLLAQLWGYEHIGALHPSPTAPFEIWSDRGEYVSAGARETCLQLGINLAINASYRPDLKGSVEVLHRIAKDQQYHFLPGAINARRKELENKPSANGSALTLREYVQYLYGIFTHYNLFADRSHLMNVEMMGRGVQPTPASIWSFGHEVGIGYRKALSQHSLVTSLLQRGSATARRNGIFLESLQYEAPVAEAQEWTAQARNFGVAEHAVYHFPGSMSRFWWPDPSGLLHDFWLRSNARATPEITLDEWRDSLMFDRCQREEREYRRLEASIRQLEAQEKLRETAIKRAVEADAAYEGLRPTAREARQLENIMALATPGSGAASPSGKVEQAQDAGYDDLMDEVFASLNREVER